MMKFLKEMPNLIYIPAMLALMAVFFERCDVLVSGRPPDQGLQIGALLSALVAVVGLARHRLWAPRQLRALIQGARGSAGGPIS